MSGKYIRQWKRNYEKEPLQMAICKKRKRGKQREGLARGSNRCNRVPCTGIAQLSSPLHCLDWLLVHYRRTSLDECASLRSESVTKNKCNSWPSPKLSKKPPNALLRNMQKREAWMTQTQYVLRIERDSVLIGDNCLLFFLLLLMLLFLFVNIPFTINRLP